MTDVAVKVALHQTFGAQALFDVACPAALRPQLQRLEPTDIIRVVEHSLHHRSLLECLTDTSSQNDVL